MTNLPGPSALRQGRDRGVLDQLKARQPTPPPAASGRGRLVFALDATATREATWDRACLIQGEMFEATAALGGLDLSWSFIADTTNAEPHAGYLPLPICIGLCGGSHALAATPRSSAC